MNNKRLMQDLNVQEKKDINGGSMNPPGLWQILRDAVKGVITLMA